MVPLSKHVHTATSSRLRVLCMAEAFLWNLLMLTVLNPARLHPPEPCRRGGLRILANKTQLQNNIPPSKRPRRDTVLRYLRTQAAAMGHPPPNPEPECLWALPTNLLQVC